MRQASALAGRKACIVILANQNRQEGVAALKTGSSAYSAFMEIRSGIHHLLNKFAFVSSVSGNTPHEPAGRRQPL
jgi:hypothetical protein